MRKIAQLGLRGRQFGQQGRQPLPQAGFGLGVDVLEDSGHLGQPALGSSVELGLQLPALTIGRLDQAPPRDAELVMLARTWARRRALPSASRRAAVTSASRRSSWLDGPVLDQHGDWLAVLVDADHDAARIVRGQLERLASIVDVAVLVRQPVPECNARIAERVLQGARQRAQVRAGADLGDEIGHRRLGPATPQQIGRQHQRQRHRSPGRRAAAPADRSPTPTAGSRCSAQAPTRTSAPPRAPARRPFERVRTYGHRCRPRPRRPGPPSRG